MTAIIGIDPHKTTHMAVAIDGDEHAMARLEVRADRAQTPRLLAWAAPLGPERTWAIESAVARQGRPAEATPERLRRPDTAPPPPPRSPGTHRRGRDSHA